VAALRQTINIRAFRGKHGHEIDVTRHQVTTRAAPRHGPRVEETSTAEAVRALARREQRVERQLTYYVRELQRTLGGLRWQLNKIQREVLGVIARRHSQQLARRQLKLE